MRQSNERSSETYDYSDPHAPRPYIDMQAAIILALVIIIVFAISRFNASAGVYADVSTQPISTPALPTPAPIYYQPVPTLYPIAPAPAAPQRVDNSDHRICVFVVDCS